MTSAGALRPAGAHELEAVWRDLHLPAAAYAAACGWTLPANPARAAEWLCEGDRLVFASGAAEPPAVSVLQRGRRGREATLAVFSRSGPEFDGIDELVAGLIRVAFGDLGLRRCEWPLLSSWTRARAAACRLGFREEVTLPEACLAGGVHQDLVLAGLLAGEVAGP
jgi:hypothetical protein